MSVQSMFVSIIVAYLLGAIPFSYIIGNAYYKVNLLEKGSGNLGATNTFRVLGWKPGLLVLILDLSKGSLSVLLAILQGIHSPFALLIVAIVATLGHTYSPYIRFKGGKGVATMVGGLLVIMPVVTLILATCWLSIILVSRYVSLGAIVTAVIFPLLVLALVPHNLGVLIAVCGASAFVVYKHKSNIKKLLSGTESKISVDDFRK